MKWFSNNQKLMMLVSLILMSFTFLPAKKRIRVYLIGDSTVSNYEPKQFPMTGWGMPFLYFFDSTVTINNRARGGRSTRTFLSENLWKPVVDSLSDGDYVFIQFGHNDEAKEPQYAARYTPVNDYKKNLEKFIDETRSKKATPVLVTPVSRMKFDKDGKALETHTDYTKAVFEVGKQTNTPIIDLDTKSRELFQTLGPVKAKLLFNQLEPNEHPNYPAGIKDNTHFNEYGARRIAELVLVEIKNQKLELADKIIKRDLQK